MMRLLPKAPGGEWYFLTARGEWKTLDRPAGQWISLADVVRKQERRRLAPCPRCGEIGRTPLGPWEPETDTEYEQRVQEERYGDA